MTKKCLLQLGSIITQNLKVEGKEKQRQVEDYAAIDP